MDALLLGRPANMMLLALGLHPPPTTLDHNTSPSAILLGRPWSQGVVSSTTIVFLDDLDRQLLHIGNIHTSPRYNSDQLNLSPNVFNSGEFMFSDMLDLTMTPSTHTTSTICRRLPGYILPNVDNRLHTFASPPRTRKQLYLEVAAGEEEATAG